MHEVLTSYIFILLPDLLTFARSMFYIGVTGFQIDKVLQPSLVTDRQTDWLADPVAAGRHTDGQTDGLCIADLYGLKQPSSPNPQIKAWDLTLDD